MALCIPTLLEINISVRGNREENIIYNEYLIDFLEELLSTHMVRLPRIIHTGKIDQKSHGLLKLKLFIILLHKQGRLQVTLSNNYVIARLLDLLLFAVEVERGNNLIEICGDIIYTNDQSIERTLLSPASTYKNSPWKIYKHFHDQKTINNIEAICGYLSKQKQVYAVALEFLFKMLTKNSEKCNEVLILLQMFISHPINVNDACSLHFLILDNLLLEYRWNLITDSSKIRRETETYNTGRKNYNRLDELIHIRDSLTHQKAEEISMIGIKNNILHTCLIIETLGLYAKILRQQKNEMLLIKSLQCIIEKSTSKQFIVRTSAFYAMETIRLAYSLNSISDLIHINVDYLIHTISNGFSKPNNNIEAAVHILGNTLTLNSSLILFNIESIISTFTSEISKPSQSTNTLSFVNASKFILSRIYDFTFKSSVIRDKKHTHSRNLQKSFDLWMEILYTEKLSRSNSMVNVELTCVNNHRVSKGYETTSITRFAAIILKQAISLLNSKNLELNILTLETISIGLDIIRDDENELLPMVNLIWNVLIEQCFRENNKILLRCCLHLITKLAKYAKEFIKKRFMR